MPSPSRSNPNTTADQFDVTHQAVVLASANYWLAKVEEACVASGCDPAYCRVRDSLKRSVDSERAELRRLRKFAVPQNHQGVAA